jgi:pimeloyl-ACP methyl ester carboxylesterase
VFVNGWSCSDAYWGDILPALEADGHTVVIHDHRGHAQSGLPREPGPNARNLTRDDLSVERVAADVIAVLDDAGIDEAVLVGHSMGVQVMLDAYRQAPDRVAALVAVAGAFENPIKTIYGLPPVLDFLWPIVSRLTELIPGSVYKKLLAGTSNAEFSLKGARVMRAAGPKATAERMAPYLLHLGSRDPKVLFKMATGMRGHSARPILPEIDVPTLVVAAGRDTFTPPRCQKAMYEAVPDAEIVWFDEGGHTLPIEEPEAIADAIEDFLARRITEKRAA